MNITKDEQDRHFLAVAYEYAKQTSPDPRTQNGAVIVNLDNEIISYGANCFPAGINSSADRLTPEKKCTYLEHAERDAIFSALRKGKNTQGAKIYVPWFACSDCAKAIIGAGIRTVIGHLQPCLTSTTWSATIDIGLALLEEAGVKCLYYDGKIGVANLRFSGETVDR